MDSGLDTWMVTSTYPYQWILLWILELGWTGMDTRTRMDSNGLGRILRCILWILSGCWDGYWIDTELDAGMDTGMDTGLDTGMVSSTNPPHQ